MAKSLRTSLLVGLRRLPIIALAISGLMFGGPKVVYAQAPMTVKVYGCPAGTATAKADALREEFGAVPGFRVAADLRTSQVVVQAPPEIQARVSQQLVAGGGASAVRPAASSPSDKTSAGSGTRRSRVVPLRATTADQMEAALWGMLGSRLSALPGAQAPARSYRLSVAGGGAVQVDIDPTARHVTVVGPGPAVEASARLVEVLDSPSESKGRNTRLIPLRSAKPASIEQMANALRQGTGRVTPAMPLAASLFPARNQLVAAPGETTPAPKPPAVAAKPPVVAAKPGEEKLPSGLVNPVQIEVLEGLDVLVLRGNPQDVEQVMEIINQIERLSVETEPVIEVLMLKHTDCLAMTSVIRMLYDEVYLSRQGNVHIMALVKPNALLVVGRKENIRTVGELVERLDQPVEPNTQFQVFRLRHAAAATAQATVMEFFVDRGGLSPLVRVTADARSNALIVQAGPRDMAEATELIRRIDTPSSAAVNEVRIIRLEHSMAQDLANIMQSAIGAAGGVRGGAAGQNQQFQQMQPQQQPGGPNAAGQAASGQRSAVLRFLTIDAKGRRLLNSGILNDIRITADTRANALLVSAPAESMELIEALIHHLDQLPAAEAQLKVFTIVNGDAPNLAEMLRLLFGSQTGNQGQGGMMGMMGMMGLQSSVTGNEASLIPLRFAVDTRTNSIIASGATADLLVVEAVLMRLDDSDVRQRKSVVFRLKNSPAIDVANAVNEFLRNERQVQQQTPGMTSPFEQIEREVVVVPEPVSNSMILSATPRFFDEVKALIEQLDARPPMVMIQVMIAEVQLGNTNEFGIELGLQDAVLFDRSILSNIQTISTTTSQTGQPQVTTQSVVAANNNPGFAFNNGQPLGNSGSQKALNASGRAGTQGLANFAVGRTNDRLGFGGLVLSASSESVSVLIRALNECHRLEVLQRPQVMTLDNQPAFIQVGQRVPRITGTQVNNIGQVNTVTLENVGLILGVTPRISPDGLVVMEIDAEKSELGPEAEGIPVSISEGQVIRSPRINTTTAQTTVSAVSGQTVVLGGLIARTKNEFHRKVPLLGDIPLIGRLFRFDGVNNERRELLIIMTPHIVRNEADADALKRAEAARMSWCISDVVQVYGEAGLRRRTDDWSDAETTVIYPDGKPGPQPGVMNGTRSAASGNGAGSGKPEEIPIPTGATDRMPELQPVAPVPPGTPLPPSPTPPPGPTLPPPVGPTPSLDAGGELRYRDPHQAQFPGFSPAGQPAGPQAGMHVQPVIYHAPANEPVPPPQPPMYR